MDANRVRLHDLKGGTVNVFEARLAARSLR